MKWPSKGDCAKPGLQFSLQDSLTWWIEKTNSHKVPSDLHTMALQRAHMASHACVCAHTHTLDKNVLK